MNKTQLNPDSFVGATVFHLCSNTLTTQTGFELSLQAIQLAKQHQLTVSFDLNLRAELWPNSEIDFAKLEQVIELADLVKFSEEELEQVGGTQQHDYIQEKLGAGVKLVLVTNGGEPIEYFTSKFSGCIAVPKTNVLDTTGAGDSFVAGFLTAIANTSGFSEVVAKQASLQQVIAFASECSAVTVSRYGACASFPVLEEVKKSSWNTLIKRF